MKDTAINILGVLQGLRPKTEKNKSIDTASKIVFRDGKAWSWAGNVMVYVPFESISSKPFAVEADMIFNVISKLKSRETEITLTDDNKLLIATATSKTEIVAMDAGEIPCPNEGQWYNVDDEFAKSLSDCLIPSSGQFEGVILDPATKSAYSADVSQLGKSELGYEIPECWLSSDNVWNLGSMSFGRKAVAISYSSPWLLIRFDDDSVFACTCKSTKYYANKDIVCNLVNCTGFSSECTLSFGDDATEAVNLVKLFIEKKGAGYTSITAHVQGSTATFLCRNTKGQSSATCSVQGVPEGRTIQFAVAAHTLERIATSKSPCDLMSNSDGERVIVLHPTDSTRVVISTDAVSE